MAHGRRPWSLLVAMGSRRRCNALRLSQGRTRGGPARCESGASSSAALDARRVRQSSRYPLWVGSETGNNLPIFSGMSKRALRAEPTVTVECLVADTSGC
jgi:hypothetical protein